MASRTKQMTEQHVIDKEAQELLKRILPKHWILREYRPDYGLDYALEIFHEIPPGKKNKPGTRFETLGEHVFLQLKGARKAERRHLKVYSRGNVEKMAVRENRKDLASEIETLPLSIETSELFTVQRMGAMLPVLLIRADLDAGMCYFVCLNDYIDKILIPRYGAYTKKASRMVHIPAANDLACQKDTVTVFRWYAKRAKLIAAFQKIIYQQMELSYAASLDDRKDLLRRAKHFGLLLSNYDFWDDTPIWRDIPHCGAALKRFLGNRSPMLTGRSDRAQEALELWRCLSILPRKYEEICREWFLPTWLGLQT